MGGTTAASVDTGSTSEVSSTSLELVSTTSESMSESTSSPVDGHPELVISDAPIYDFGSLELTDATGHAFSISNEGDGDATSLLLSVEGAAFVITSHDCDDVLAARASCEVEVSFQPGLFGDVGSELEIAYQDQGMATSVTRSLVGRGVGATANLLINGGGELGDATDIPPMGWTIVYGPNWSASWLLAPPVEGARTISAGWGPPGTNNFTLYQQLDAASLTTWGDAVGVRFYYRAFHRAETDGNDPTWVEFRFLDAGGLELAIYPSSLSSGATWYESTGNFLAPPGTHQVQLALQCDRVANDWCSGFFDGLEVWAEWLG